MVMVGRKDIRNGHVLSNYHREIVELMYTQNASSSNIYFIFYDPTVNYSRRVLSRFILMDILLKMATCCVQHQG
jgi:hypothetical protein